ncbi:GRIM-19 protein-domain-containing protein [Baffinella frigidus]|nr:GRIM-19 protein-domain-containing protein [Cryptophyta sp. CCMP2293]
MLSRLARGLRVPNVGRPQAGANRKMSGEPIKGHDPRKAGPAGTGYKPYEGVNKGFKQDMPPPGGFPTVRTKRYVGETLSVHPLLILGGVAAMMTYGLYAVGQTNIKRRGWKKEKLQCRYNIVPYMVAEEDVEYLKRQEILDAREAEIMKDVPGWVVNQSCYHSKRWTEPLYNDRRMAP